jgi:hypothetical protein
MQAARNKRLIDRTSDSEFLSTEIAMLGQLLKR